MGWRREGSEGGKGGGSKRDVNEGGREVRKGEGRRKRREGTKRNFAIAGRSSASPPVPNEGQDVADRGGVRQGAPLHLCARNPH